MPIALACASCSDTALVRALPFVFYWALLFLLWALLWGPVSAGLSWWSGARPSVRPWRYLLAACALVLGSAIWLGASALQPLLVFLPVWLLRLWERDPLAAGAPATPRVERFAHVAARARRVTLSLAALLVPAAYVRQYVQSNPQVLPFRELLLVPEPLAAVGGVVFAWAILAALWELRVRQRAA
ncbi:MAG TPA: hypothetical protein DEA08_10615 [Planctomycetes bacterium]|nr:hypothetical protein [Planctomycetota bacterium]